MAAADHDADAAAALQARSDEAWAALAARGTLEAPAGRTTILGFGSLLSERSARCTFPGLERFRLGRLEGWRREFRHASPFFVQTGIARAATGELASLSASRDPEAPALLVAVFDLADEAMPAFYRREAEYRWSTEPALPHAFGDAARRAVAALPEGARACRGVVCAGFDSDEQYTAERFDGSAERLRERYAPHGIDRVWRDDLLPCRVYLRHCVLSARGWGAAVGDNFVDSTFLGDRRTTVREHLARNPGLLDERPPPVLAERYNGP